MTIRVNLKVVPNASPNADGKWISLDLPNSAELVCALEAKHFTTQADYFVGHVPTGHHIVGVESESRP